MNRHDSKVLVQGKKVKTIVSKKIYDIESGNESGNERLLYYYAYLSLKDGVATLEVDDTRPLSEDEVDEFNKRKEVQY